MPPAQRGEGHSQEDQRKKVISFILFEILLLLHIHCLLGRPLT